MQIIDSHAHLEFAQFDEDRAAMLERARAAGVQALLAIGSGTSPTERLDAAIPFAEQHDWIYATVGIHPHDAAKAAPDTWQRLEDLLAHPRIIAIGARKDRATMPTTPDMTANRDSTAPLMKALCDPTRS